MPHRETTQISVPPRRLKPGDHVCLIYRTRVEQMAAAVPFLRQGLESGEKCVFAAARADDPAVLRALAKHGVDVEAGRRSGQLKVVSAVDTYAPGGVFDPHAMARRAEAAVDAALQAGWKGLRVASDASWTRNGGMDWSRLSEYESLIEGVFQRRPLAALCMYREMDHSPRCLLDILAIHPMVSARGATCRNFFRHAAALQGNRTARREHYRTYLECLPEWAGIERELQDSRRRFMELMEGIDAIVWEGDAATFRFSFVSHRAETITGYPVEQWLAEPDFWTTLVHPDDLGWVFRECADATQRGDGHELEYRAVTRDGRVIWLHDVTHVVVDDDGRPRLLRGVLVDISRRKQAELERESQLATFRSLVENMQAGVAIETADRRLMTANQPLCAMFGLPDPPDALVGIDCVRLTERLADGVTEPDVFAARMERIVAERRPVTGEIIRFADGRVCERDYVPIAAPDGSFLGHMWQYRNVTRRVALEEQLRQSQKMEAIGRLAGGIAHDFNNLMTAVIGYSETILLDLPRQDPLCAEIEQIKTAAERAVSLTRQLLAFSRKELVAPQVIDLNGAVANVDRLLRRLIGEDVELVTVFAPSPALVHADAGHVHQVLMNLAVNARDAMHAGGKLTIQVAHEDPDLATLTFADTGCGMEAETMERIFEPFFSTKEGRGTGLGLTLVYGIVQQHGGTIRVASEPGRGSTFTIALPACSLPDATRPADREPVPALSGLETVLLVEDDPTMRGFARKILVSRGYRVLEASYGIQALDIVDGHDGPIHLLLTDVVMPHMSGHELARRLLERRPEVRILFISGYTEFAEALPGLEGVDVAFLPKPFSLRTLLSKVRETLDQTLKKT